MTKIYPIIPLNNHLYMVDKETVIEENDWCYSGFFMRVYQNKRKEGDVFTPYAIGARKVLASTDTSIGLPLLPEVKEPTWDKNRQIAFTYACSENRDTKCTTQEQLRFFNAGYKAASVKKYTEEDMKQAILKAWDNSEDTKNIDDIIQSLTPKPIAVEVEMEEDPSYVCLHENDKGFKPKTKDNYIVVKRWMYERNS